MLGRKNKNKNGINSYLLQKLPQTGHQSAKKEMELTYKTCYIKEKQATMPNMKKTKMQHINRMTDQHIAKIAQNKSQGGQRNVRHPRIRWN